MVKHINTNWSKGNSITPEVEIGKLVIDNNNITFHLDGYSDIFSRNFVGRNEDHIYKVYTYGQSGSDSTGYFYKVSKVFLYNGNDYEKFNGDYIEGINSFSFEVSGLVDWLGIPSIEVLSDENKRVLLKELETPRFVLNSHDPYIFIEYEFKELIKGIDNNNSMFLEKIPRVNVQFSKPVNDKTVQLNIDIIMRFLGLLLGSVSDVKDIRLTFGKEQFRMWLYVNYDFSINSNRNTYWQNPRTQFAEIKENLQRWFEKWYLFSQDESLNFIQNAYFQIQRNKKYNLEDVLITYNKFRK